MMEMESSHEDVRCYFECTRDVQTVCSFYYSCNPFIVRMCSIKLLSDYLYIGTNHSLEVISLNTIISVTVPTPLSI